MIIRPADIDDAHAIGTILVRSWQHTYADILPPDGLANLSIEQHAQEWAGWLQAEGNPKQVLVAEEDGEVIGFTSWGPNPEDDAVPDSMMLYSIYVLPGSMSKGIGSQLLEAAEVDMIAGGARAAMLEVLVENTPTRKFYERHGWLLEPDSEQDQSFFEMEMTTIRYRKAFI